MQEHFAKALDFANYQQTFSIQKKTLKERSEAKLTYGISGGIFRIDRDLLTFVEILITKGRTHSVVLLDINQNPILIDDLTVFRDQIFDRYFQVTNEYFEHYQNIKKSRSVERLLDK